MTPGRAGHPCLCLQILKPGRAEHSCGLALLARRPLNLPSLIIDKEMAPSANSHSAFRGGPPITQQCPMPSPRTPSQTWLNGSRASQVNMKRQGAGRLTTPAPLATYSPRALSKAYTSGALASAPAISARARCKHRSLAISADSPMRGRRRAHSYTTSANALQLAMNTPATT